ncbi:CPBP family intramembrane metalloprotease [Parvimonas micra]|uniref:CPBP family intramembrane glutamic endopeptidase n=1 Tax=Parvimonas micra TaxID=33033 RepID=UPI000E537CEC|nr:CPBP family intramembrane glutamic endopeptidase [Parvimonas micra]AXU10072.1 CPBP family intramembrane metalloprotease [Parvimonas micra]
MGNIKNSKKWVAPVLMFVFCDFIYRQHLVKYLLDRDCLVVNFFENSFLNKTFSFGLLNFAVAVIILLISKFIFKEKLTSIDSSDKISIKKSAIIVFLAVVVTIIIFYLLTYIIYDVLGSLVNSAAAIYIRDMYMRNKFIYVIFTFFTVTFEEVVYRKLLFGYLYDLHSGCNRYIRLITSLLGSVIIFGAIHDGILSSGMIYYVVAGISFTIVYFYTKRISAAIAIHFLYNICLRLIRTII